MLRHVQRQLRQQRHLLHLELPASYSTRLMSKFGRNGYEASFGCGAADAAAAAIECERSNSDGGGGGGTGTGTGGGSGTRGRRECGSRADDLNSLDGDVMLMEEQENEHEVDVDVDDVYGDEILLGAVPTPASERANRVLVNAQAQQPSHRIQIKLLYCNKTHNRPTPLPCIRHENSTDILLILLLNYSIRNTLCHLSMRPSPSIPQ